MISLEKTRNRIFIERNQNVDEIVPMFVANKSNLHNKDLHETQKKKPHEKMAESKTSGCIAVLRCNIICYDCSSTKRMKNKNEQKEREKNETDLNPI